MLGNVMLRRGKYSTGKGATLQVLELQVSCSLHNYNAKISTRFIIQ